MTSKVGIETQIVRLGEKHQLQQLQQLVQNTSVKVLTDALKAKIGRPECINLWNYLLKSFDPSNLNARAKRFACVKCVLDGLLSIELSYRQSYDLVTRLCQDFSTFPSDQLLEILEHCMDSMRAGDKKCLSWKDLLPEALDALANCSQLCVNGISMSGAEYRSSTVRSICMMRWPTEVLTPIADMFKNLVTAHADVCLVLNKFAGQMPQLPPDELPALAFQLFSMCQTAAQVIIPILAFDRYFYSFYYKKLFADMDSDSVDFDSIDKYSDKELREAEETVLHHLNYCTQYKISEVQMCIMLRNFLATPDVILTPFMLSAILSMTAANREPDTLLSKSVLLAFLRSVIKHNEDERSLADYSVWCRDSFNRKQVELEQIFTVLIDQNKEGKDVITPGLVNLAFMLLKARNNKALNDLGINFLIKFIRKRFVFGRGVVKKVAEWMIVEQDQHQFAECLTLLSVADTFTVSECIQTIQYVMDFFVWLPGEQSMRMMSFILPILKLSPRVRDAFIEVLRKALKSSQAKIRRMAVYGFCMILKQLNNSNSQRSQISMSSFCTQHSISGFSLMTQASMTHHNNPHRHFNMLTLEIIGLLRNCFNEQLHIKLTLYENLQRAIELNHKLVPHVLQFLDNHFRSYFTEVTNDELIQTTQMLSANNETNDFTVHFKQLLRSLNDQDNDIEVIDNLGILILCLTNCLVIFEQFESEYDIRPIKRLLNMAVQKVLNKELKFPETSGNFTLYKHEMATQQLNFLEGLISYQLLMAKQTNEKVKQVLPLFKAHQRIAEALKTLTTAKKLNKKSQNNATESSVCQNMTLNGILLKKTPNSVSNIWDLSIIEKLLRLLHENIVTFAHSQHTTALRSDVQFVRYVLEVASIKVAGIRAEPAYKQLTHSKRTLKYLTDITKVVFERCIKRLPELWRDFDAKTAMLAAECFLQCLRTANETYKKKFQSVFVRGFDMASINNSKIAAVCVQDVIDEFMQEVVTMENDKDAVTKNADGIKMLYCLLQSLEIFYDNVTFSNRLTTDSYIWLFKYCTDYAVESKELSFVHKLLFVQRQKTHSGTFFNTIAMHLTQLWGEISEADSQLEFAFRLKSITNTSAEVCLQYLYATLRKQLEDVEYFILKANSSLYRCRLLADAEKQELGWNNLRTLERAICAQLMHVSNTLLQLTNVCIPLGLLMDGLLKLLMQHYICLKNLTKHFMSCSGSAQFSLHGTKFEVLLRTIGKALPVNVYALISYIEANIISTDDAKAKPKLNPQALKAKVLRETKLIPKVVHCIENLNKHVIMLDKKIKSSLSNLCHTGTVRDFRIRTKDLKAAVQRTLSHSSEIEQVESNFTANEESETEEQNEQDEEEEDEEENENVEEEEEEQQADEDALLERMENEVAAKSTRLRHKKVILNSDNEENSEPDDNQAENSNAESEAESVAASTATKPISRRRKTQKSSVANEEAEVEPSIHPGPKSKKVAKTAKKTKAIAPPPTATAVTTAAIGATAASPASSASPAAKESYTQVLNNLQKINKEVRKKRSLQESENTDPDVASAPMPATKKRRGRSAKK